MIENVKKSVEENSPKNNKRKIISQDFQSSESNVIYKEKKSNNKNGTKKFKSIFSGIYFLLSFGDEIDIKNKIEDEIKKYGGKVIEEDNQINDINKLINNKIVLISSQSLRTKKMLISLSIGIGNTFY
jgi:hypothetical protein